MITIPAPLAEALGIDRFAKLFFEKRGDDYIISNVEFDGMATCRVVRRGRRYYLDLPEKRKRWVLERMWGNNFILRYTDKNVDRRYARAQREIVKMAKEQAENTYSVTGKKVYRDIADRCEEVLRKLEKIEEVEDEGK